MQRSHLFLVTCTKKRVPLEKSQLAFPPNPPSLQKEPNDVEPPQFRIEDPVDGISAQNPRLGPTPLPEEGGKMEPEMELQGSPAISFLLGSLKELCMRLPNDCCQCPRFRKTSTQTSQVTHSSFSTLAVGPRRGPFKQAVFHDVVPRHQQSYHCEWAA